MIRLFKYLFIIILLNSIGYAQSNCFKLINELYEKLPTLVDSKTDTAIKHLNKIKANQLKCYPKLSTEEIIELSYLKADSWFLIYEKQLLFDSALYYGKKVIKYALKTKDKSKITTSYFNYALFFLNNNEYDSSILYNKEGLNIALKNNIKQPIAIGYYNLANIYDRLINDSLCMLYINKSLLYIDSINEPRQYAKSLILLGTNCFIQGNAPKAVSFLLKAKKIAKKNNLTTIHLNTIVTCSNLFINMEIYFRALELIDEGESIVKKGKYPYYQATFNMFRGTILYVKNVDFTKSINYLEKAIKIYETNSSYSDISTCYFYLASIYLEKQEFKKAEEYISKSIELGDPINLGSSYCMLARIKHTNGKTDEALSFIKKAEKLNASKQGLFNIYKLYSELYEKKNDFNKALIYSKKLYIIRDSLNGVKVQTAINKIIYLDQEEINNEKHKTILFKNKAKKNRLYLIIVSLGSLIIVFLLIIISLYIKNVSKRQQAILSEKEIEIKELSLERSFKKINELKHAILSQNEIINELKNVENKKSNRELAEKLLGGINSNKNWSLFMIEFELIHKDFLSSIKAENSSLTKNDVRFISLLKLNLKDSEIAELLNIEYDSVRKIKYRIKNKIDLSVNEYAQLF